MLKGKRANTKQDARGRTLITHYDNHSPISEQYRTIRTNISFSTVDQEIKTLLITSTMPSEGKTTTAANLAVVMAQQGKRTLLIDGDVRKPTLHFTFHVRNTCGLTTVLGNYAEVGEAIRHTEVVNLDLLSSGPTPPNPSELLGSNAMRELLNKVSGFYDIIIIDSPPILVVTDAQVLANQVDGSILVIGYGKTNREAALKAQGQLKKANGKLLGAILNRKSIKDQNTDYYYYNRSYNDLL